MSNAQYTFPHWDDGRPAQYPSILEALKDQRVLSIKLTEGNLFRVREECDKYFTLELTRQQLRALGEELIALSDPIPTAPAP